MCVHVRIRTYVRARVCVCVCVVTLIIPHYTCPLSQTTYQTEMGQTLDLLTSPDDNVDFSRFSMERYVPRVRVEHIWGEGDKADFEEKNLTT